jgi:5'-deoxynucleotidase YfbR-like HD superfamily hydrolase
MTALLEDLLDGGLIARYHVKGTRMLVPQNVAEHSWRMSAVLFYLWPEARAAVVWATLFHDVSERVTGDMPSNIKRHSPQLAKALNEVSTAEEYRLGIRFDLTPEEEKLLGWIDRFEGAMKCVDELEMGNRKAIGTMRRYIQYAGDPKYILMCPEREALRQELTRALDCKAASLTNHEEPQL